MKKLAEKRQKQVFKGFLPNLCYYTSQLVLPSHFIKPAHA